MIFYRTPDHRHPQPGAAATHHFTRVKRFKNHIQFFLWNPHPIITDCQDHILPGNGGLISFDGRVDIPVFSFHNNRPLLLYRLKTVDQEVHKGLFQMHRRPGQTEQIGS